MLATHKYDVFLSFNGKDTRKKFISHLYKELGQRKIRAFKDDVELKCGQRISSGLGCGIKESRFAIVVVSVNYTSSSWCLDELVMIMELVDKKKLTVIPIFYGVDPANLRHQIGEVAKHFKKHEKRHDYKKIRLWKEALVGLANFLGRCSGEKEESKLVDEIADSISNTLSSLNSDVRLIRIWGRWSMERLAFASHVYEKIKHNFHARCFLDNVWKISFSHHCNNANLQEELLSKMEGQALPTETTYMSPSAIKTRLRNKKVLSLDANNVDKLELLDALGAEVYRLLGPGSNITITTQDTQLRDSPMVKWVCEFEQLKCYENRLLYREWAFKRENHGGSEQLKCHENHPLSRSLAIQREGYACSDI